MEPIYNPFGFGPNPKSEPKTNPNIGTAKGLMDFKATGTGGVFRANTVPAVSASTGAAKPATVMAGPKIPLPATDAFEFPSAKHPVGTRLGKYMMGEYGWYNEALRKSQIAVQAADHIPMYMRGKSSSMGANLAYGVGAVMFLGFFYQLAGHLTMDGFLPKKK